MRAHLMNPRPDLSRVVPGCSALLGLALQKGLAIRPEDRFQTAEEMLVAIERAMTAPAREAATRVRASAPSMPRRRTGDNIPAAVDVKAGGRRLGNPGVQKGEVATDPAVARVERETSSGPTVVVNDSAVVAAVRKAAKEDEESESAMTAREGFRPLVSPSPQGPGETLVEVESQMPTQIGLDPVRLEEVTAPSAPHAQPLGATPGYLTPPFLIGAAVILLILGVLLGKLL